MSHNNTSKFGEMLARAAGRRWSRGRSLAVLIATFALALVAPGAASAAFVRPFLRQITTSPPFSFPLSTQNKLFSAAGGLALDKSEDLWVGDDLYPNVTLSKFAAASATPPNEFETAVTTEAFTAPASISIERTTGNIFVTGIQSYEPEFGAEYSEPTVEVFDDTGKLVKRWSRFGYRTNVAVDNSSCSPDCTVYVSHEIKDPEPPAGDGLPNGVEKFNSKDEPVDFTAKAAYIKEHEIIGAPTGAGGCEEGTFAEHYDSPGAIAVDSEGNIYVVDDGCTSEGAAVIEYRSTGEFVRIFTGAETPGIGGSLEDGFGGTLENLTVDPVSHHLLVSVRQRNVEGSEETNVGAIDEFEVGSGRFVNQITETTGGASLSSPSAIAADADGDVYVTDELQKAVDVYGAGHFLPGLRLAEPSDRAATSVVLNGAVNPENQPLEGCKFEYATAAAYAKEGFTNAETAECTPTAAAIAGAGEPDAYHAVHADLTGLASGTSYRYRLAAASSGELGGTATSATAAFTAPAAPLVLAGSTAATNLSSTFADFAATIDPRGASTSYYFQYVTAADFAASGYADASTTSAVELGSGGPTGSAAEPVLQSVAGLVPGTAYEFRVLASNALGTTPGEDGSFATLASPLTGLPDGRAYELVTPPNKEGGSDLFGGVESEVGQVENTDVGIPSESGEEFLLQTHASFGPFSGNESSAYVFSRGASGWTYTSLASPALGVQNVVPAVFDPADLSRVGIDDFVGSGASESGSRNTDLIGAPAGPYVSLHADAPIHGTTTTGAEEARIVGASHDLSHVILESRGGSTLCPEASTQQHGEVLCEWAGGYETHGAESTPALKLVNVTSKGALLDRCGAVLGPGGGKGSGATGGKAHDAVSVDGSRVFFMAPDPEAKNAGPGCWKPSETGPEEDPPQVYMRAGGVTLELSAPEAGATDPTGQHPAEYIGASEDGSKVFFLTRTELTKQAVALGLHDLELYECEIVEAEAHPKCKLTRVSAGEAGTPGAATGAHVYEVPAIAAEGGAVYFTAYGALDDGATEYTEPFSTNEGSVNLYRYDTETGTTKYVATIGTKDSPEGVSECGGVIREPQTDGQGRARAMCPKASRYTTPDGRYLLFASSRDLTGYSTVGPCHIPNNEDISNGHCTELYRYDSQTGSLICVSCNPSGAAPVSNALFSRSAPTGPASGPVRAMSDDGAYVFFDTGDALVSQDTNETLDVYEWHEGHVALISSGKDLSPSFFLGSSPSGDNVFFGTHARLVPQDTDSNGDIYDARVCTSSDPCIQPPSGATAQCEGDSCQIPPPQPVDATPGSLTFSGVGDLVSALPVPAVTKKTTPKCKQGYVRKRVKQKQTCVKKPKKKSKAKKAGHGGRTKS